MLSEKDTIEIGDVPDSVLLEVKQSDVVQVTDIIPLKQALALTEFNLIALARKKCGTTTKMAKDLGVNQSTISRKMRKLGIL